MPYAMQVEEAEARCSAALQSVKQNDMTLFDLNEGLQDKKRFSTHSKTYTAKLTSRLEILENKLSSVTDRATKAESRIIVLEEKVEKAYDERDKWKKDFEDATAELANVREELDEMCG